MEARRACAWEGMGILLSPGHRHSSIKNGEDEIMKITVKSARFARSAVQRTKAAKGLNLK
ncbi:MAG TPA: hypothetical protein VG734_21760 [Lacunisphaera sp.]|nr:hypothetical protein [Lacunisphaera sp.]